MPNTETSRRVPWIAQLLSLLAPGVGHLYCGRSAKAATLYLAWTFVLLCAVVAALSPRSRQVFLLLLVLPTLGLMFVYVYAIVDARRLAKQIGSNYSLRDYNRAMIYGLLILVHNLYPIALLLGVRGLVYVPYSVPVNSASPTILKGDCILARKVFIKQTPDRGDLVLYRNPSPTGGALFLGRVIALAGDQLEINGPRIVVNGKELTRTPVPNANRKNLNDPLVETKFYEQDSKHRYLVSYIGLAPGNKPIELQATVPEGKAFILGDNRDRSRDSRHFGAIDQTEILGYIDYVYWPAETWTRFGVADRGHRNLRE